MLDEELFGWVDARLEGATIDGAIEQSDAWDTIQAEIDDRHLSAAERDSIARAVLIRAYQKGLVEEDELRLGGVDPPPGFDDSEPR